MAAPHAPDARRARSLLPRRTFLARAAAALGVGTLVARPRRAGAAPQDAEPFLGEIRLFAGTFAPSGWMICDGRVLPIGGNTALFSILLTRFGGDGVSTFAIPDLRGRVPIGAGQGPGLTLRGVGDSLGTETHALTLAQLPFHTHAWRAHAGNGSTDVPTGGVLARSAAAIPQFAAAADVDLAAAAIASTGGGAAHQNLQPSLTLTYIMAGFGVYPSMP